MVISRRHTGRPDMNTNVGSYVASEGRGALHCVGKPIYNLLKCEFVL
jgi:hypothetical protein